MQGRTVDYIQKRHSPEDRVAPTSAMYSKDTVDGPLGSASGVEDNGGPQELVKKTVRQETTQVYKKEAPTDSEANVCLPFQSDLVLTPSRSKQIAEKSDSPSIGTVYFYDDFNVIPV